MPDLNKNITTSRIIYQVRMATPKVPGATTERPLLLQVPLRVTVIKRSDLFRLSSYISDVLSRHAVTSLNTPKAYSKVRRLRRLVYHAVWWSRREDIEIKVVDVIDIEQILLVARVKQ